MVRNIIAILAGYAASTLCILLLFILFGLLFPGFFPDPLTDEAPGNSLLVLTLSLGVVGGILGGYVTAMIAAKRKLLCSVTLGVLMILLGILTMITEQGAKPTWWHFFLFVIVIPSTSLGGYLRVGKKK